MKFKVLWNLWQPHFQKNCQQLHEAVRHVLIQSSISKQQELNSEIMRFFIYKIRITQTFPSICRLAFSYNIFENQSLRRSAKEFSQKPIHKSQSQWNTYTLIKRSVPGNTEMQTNTIFLYLTSQFTLIFTSFVCVTPQILWS